MKRLSRGFTLIELMVVVAIVGILAAVAVGQYARSITKAKEAVLQENLFRMRTAIQLYFADKGRYPDTLDSLVTDRYLRDVPTDTVTGRRDSWIIAHVEPSDQGIFDETGIFDVFSGASGVALDGTNYSEW